VFGLLTSEQLERYDRDGCLLVSGLTPPGVITTALETMWQAMEMDPSDQLTLGSPPDHVNALIVFPTEGDWDWPKGHIDHSIREHGHKTFPKAFRIATMIYLNNVEPQSGGTIVWPGSHRQIHALAESDPDRYEYMWMHGDEVAEMDFGQPADLSPRCGDVLFYQDLCFHSGSKNMRTEPRFAFNHKW